MMGRRIPHDGGLHDGWTVAHPRLIGARGATRRAASSACHPSPQAAEERRPQSVLPVRAVPQVLKTVTAFSAGPPAQLCASGTSRAFSRLTASPQRRSMKP
jgi:hypothetical protein